MDASGFDQVIIHVLASQSSQKLTHSEVLQHALLPKGHLNAGRWLFDMHASSHQIPEKHSRVLRKYLVTPYFRLRRFRSRSNAKSEM